MAPFGVCNAKINVENLSAFDSLIFQKSSDLKLNYAIIQLF